MKKTPLLTVIAQRCNCMNNLLFNIITPPPSVYQSYKYLQNENTIITLHIYKMKIQ